MTSIGSFVECLEGSASAALAHRQRVVRKHRHAGPGPIDLVWVRKTCPGSFNDTTQDYFHHVVGYDISSTASAAAYFASLCNAQPKVWHINQTYGCFEKFDLLCRPLSAPLTWCTNMSV